jgi:hypothetical protein
MCARAVNVVYTYKPVMPPPMLLLMMLATVGFRLASLPAPLLVLTKLPAPILPCGSALAEIGVRQTHQRVLKVRRLWLQQAQAHDTAVAQLHTADDSQLLVPIVHR